MSHKKERRVSVKSCPYGGSACISLHFSDVPVLKSHSVNLSSQHYRKFPSRRENVLICFIKI